MNDVMSLLYSFTIRIGFFEFIWIKIIQMLIEVMNLKYNLKAYLDKITPGFDPYGIPLIKINCIFCGIILKTFIIEV